MPHASLLMMTSPILLGTAPQAAAVDASFATPSALPVAVAIQAEVEGLSTPKRDWELLPLDWSLAAAQPQQDGPPDEASSQSDREPPTENEIVVEGEYGPVEADPMGEFNETSYRITQDLDEVFLEPVAYAYRDGLPGPIRQGLGNVVRNLGEPANFLNFLLQFKIGDALETLGRFAINSTLGLGGLIDIAEKPGINLPYRRNGFANTMGYYGVGTGPYLYLPVTGATTLRDLVGNTLDQAVLPTAVGRPFNTPEYAIPYFVISNLEARLEVDQELARIGETVDPYAARRDTYLYRREREIALLKGEEPPEPPSILEEVEGTGEFADDVEEPGTEPNASHRSQIEPREMPPIEATVMITKPQQR